MELGFLTPWGGLFILAVLAPLAVLGARARRIDRIRSALGLRTEVGGPRLAHAVALVVLCALLALAAAQPVVTTSRTLTERTDAQVFLVLDTSRSMLASSAAGEPTRFERSRDLAQGLANELPEVPIGLASFTDRVLPHLFPTVDRALLTATLRKTMGVESPGPAIFYVGARATSYDVLADLPQRNYFTPATTRRIAVVFTDGETRPVETDRSRPRSRRSRKSRSVFVPALGRGRADQRHRRPRGRLHAGSGQRGRPRPRSGEHRRRRRRRGGDRASRGGRHRPRRNRPDAGAGERGDAPIPHAVGRARRRASSRLRPLAKKPVASG